jgi:IclR family pca regulon transcriptional regulator
VTDPGKLRRIIEECRASGFAAVEDELAYGVVALGVPVFDQSARVVAALNSSSHSRRISKAKLVRERFAMLQQVSREISADLAGVPGLSLSANP